MNILRFMDIFTRLWEKHETVVFHTGLKNYLYTAVKYSVIDHYRKQLVRGDSYAVDSKGSSETDNSTEQDIFLKDLKNLIDELVSQLPEKCRQV